MTSQRTAPDLERYSAVVDALRAAPGDAAGFVAFDEAAFLTVGELLSEADRLLGARRAAWAGEVARRSAPELGSSGLAKRAGFRTPENFVKVMTGVSGRDAVTNVRVGTLSRDLELDAAPPKPWMTSVAARLRAGVLSVEAVDAICFRTGGAV